MMQTTDGQCLKLFDDCMLTLNETFVEEVDDFIRITYPDLWQEIWDLDKKLNEYWGKDLCRFEKTIAKFFLKNKEMIKLYNKRRTL